MPDGETDANATTSRPPFEPTIEDSRVGRLAYFAGWLTPQQIRHCLQVQKETAEEDDDGPRRFGRVAVDEGLLTPIQLKAILRIARIDKSSGSEDAFGAIAVRLGFISGVALSACLAEQKRLLHERGKAPLLGLMLAEKKLLSSEQVKEVLEEQSRLGDGPLERLRKAEDESTFGRDGAEASVVDPEAADRVVCRCEACGGTGTAQSWHEGMPCPHCGGGPFIPAPTVDLALGYSLADRRFGPAPEDNRLGMMAYFAGWMTLEQVRRCLRAQADSAAGEGETVKFGEVAVQRGMITQQRVEALLHMQSIRRPARDERTFGGIAVRKGFATQVQLDECLEEQWRCLVEHQEAPRLGILMVEKGYLSEQQVKAILQFQARYGQGPLADEEEPEKEDRGGLWGTLVANARPVVLVPLAIIVVSLFALSTSWFGAVGWQPEAIAAGCRKCHHVHMLSGTIEIACPGCKSIRTLCPVVRCEKCRTVFLFGQLGQGRRCPKCGSKQLVPFHDADEARDAWKAQREKTPK